MGCPDPRGLRAEGQTGSEAGTTAGDAAEGSGGRKLPERERCRLWSAPTRAREQTADPPGVQRNVGNIVRREGSQAEKEHTVRCHLDGALKLAKLIRGYPVSSCLGPMGWKEAGGGKSPGQWNVLYPLGGGGGGIICPNLSNCILKVGKFYCVEIMKLT